MILWKNQPMTSYDDGAFTVDKSTWGYQSYGRDGDKIVFSATQEDCVYWTRRWLKAQQEGWDTEVRVVNSGVVGGKL